MKSPSFNAYPNNWLASARIAAMLPEQEGAYFRLLCYQWNSEDQTIPADDESLAARSRLNGRWQSLGAKVRACFHAVADQPDKLRNERLWHEHQRIEDLRERQAEGGRRGMQSRYRNRAIAGNQGGDKSAISDLQDSYNRESGVGSRDQGAGNGDLKTHTHRAGAREGLLGLADKIRDARPEYARMAEIAVVNRLRPAMDAGKMDALAEAVAVWCGDHANAMGPFANPLASIGKLVERVIEGRNGAPAAGRLSERDAERQEAMRRARE